MANTKRPIPDHATRPEFIEPVVSWTPVISPGDLLIYHGQGFADWRGHALVAGLSSKAIVVVELDGSGARERTRYDMGTRIRALAERPEGALWALEDEGRDGPPQLLKLTPAG